ncbi:MAG: MiaB/RimO family radical SAM methylthiotransferase [Clostridia bacterium]|nr:MiaB/RimO family radical SAM methylthiotransferase [Clostridia bacterium]
MKAVVFSLGCKVNSYEGQAIINVLEQRGYAVSDKPGYADIYILNTCSVTAEADKKSRQAVERLKKFNRGARILVLGCSSQNNADKYLSNEAVTAVSGVGGKIQAVTRFLDGLEGDYGNELPLSYEDNLFPAATKTRGYIKVQDGCNNFCSYCRIPYLRGRSRSRKIESIVREAFAVAEHSKEIILTGINVSDYRDGDKGLTELALALKDVPCRKRLSSLECEVVDEKLLNALKESGFCDHFHLSLQSGCTEVLKKMNRHYTAEEYLDKVRLIYSVFPSAAITTDMIAGFPTETEQDHLIGIETAKAAKFAAIHVFPYSEREGTNAVKLPQIPKSERTRRASQIAQVGAILKQNFITKNLGREAVVYAETQKDGLSVGFTSNYIKVYSPLKVGEMCKVKLVEPYLDGIKGELL